MNDENLEKLLANLREDPLSPAPDLRREVRAEIARLKKQPRFWRRLLPVLHWNELLLQPRLAGCALVLAAVAGIAPGMIGHALPSPTHHAHNARASLHLDAFDAQWNAVSILPRHASHER